MLVTFLPHIPKLLANASKSGLVKAKSECLPSKPFCCFHLINPYSPSSHTIATMFNLRRTAVSRSCTFIINPASPDIDKTRRSGNAILAPIDPGIAKPIVQNPLEIKQVFGSTHWKYREIHILCAPTSDNRISPSPNTCRTSQSIF